MQCGTHYLHVYMSIIHFSTSGGPIEGELESASASDILASDFSFEYLPYKIVNQC